MSGRIGMMQGRLLPKVDGRIQAFPGPRWSEEFSLLRELGYNAIELTIETASFTTHPIRSVEGRRQIAALSQQHDIHVAGLCGDNFMESPLVGDESSVRRTGLDQLLTLIDDCAALGLPMIEVPMMGVNSLRKEGARALFDAAMEEALPRAAAAGIDIILESDLPPDELNALMNAYEHPRLGINYDMGNSTWFGYYPDDELPLYGRHVRNVHVKDCTKADYSVPLGRGETDLPRVFQLLRQIGYQGDFILQAARQPDDIQAARDYLAYLAKVMAA